jgi:hypothetical protein
MKTKLLYTIHIILAVLLAWGLGYSVARGQEGAPPAPQAPQVAVSGFTYQGSLKESGAAVNDSCSMAFRLYGSSGGADLVGAPITTTVSVSSGLFSVSLDFGNGSFDGSQRWLEVRVKCPGESSYTALARQEIKATPYALSAPWSGISGKPGNTVIVAKSGGDFNTITAALSSITTASDTNRYLVKVMPGVYTETVTMKQYVDIEGSGELATRITFSGNASGTTGTLVGANNAEVRFLTVSNTGGASYAIAIYNNSAAPRLTHITAKASGGTSNFSISSNSSSPTMSNVTANASGGTYNYAVRNISSFAEIQNSELKASGGTTINIGLFNAAVSDAYVVQVSNSKITGSSSTISNDSHFTTRVSATLLAGDAALANGGTLTCAGVYDESYAFYASTCP